MGSLTESIPKPMIVVSGRPIVEYIVDSLPEDVSEVIFVVGYLGVLIKEHFGDTYKGRKIVYVEQNTLDGTAGALWKAQAFVRERFLVLNGDDICQAADILACASSPDWAILVQRVDDVGTAGKVIVDDRGFVTEIQEKEVHSGGPGLANTANLFLLDTRVFSYPLVLRPGSDTEYGLPQTVVQASSDIPIRTVEAHALIRISEPADIARAEGLLAEIGKIH